MSCLNCGKEVSSRAKYCSDACRMKYRRKAEPEQISVEPEQKANKGEQNVRVECSGNVTFMGKDLAEIDQNFVLGDEAWCELLDCRSVYHSSELPYWMLDGDLERDSLPRARGHGVPRMSAEEKRVKFRELMFRFDERFGARNSANELIG